MKGSKACVACLRPTRIGTRCRACAPEHERSRHNPVYDSPAWRRLRARLLMTHVRRHGWTCPGMDGHEPHESRDLTVDHILGLARGGAPLDVANLRVLCRSANSAAQWRAPA